MELTSFKEVLLRKAAQNENLSAVLSSIGEDFFAEMVVEALEKMEPGTKASAPITSFGHNLDTTDVTQLRDALGHHLSHYKAALKAHYAAPEKSPEQKHFREVADKHLNHVIPLMDLANRTAAHSNGKLAISYPSLSPWETNYTTLEQRDVPEGKKGTSYKRVPKLLRLRPSKRPDSVVPDYRYLEMPPHPGHKEMATLPHAGGYPWEEVQVGAPKDIDAKKAYLHFEDIPDKKDYTEHSFDKHPIRSVQDFSADVLNDDAHKKYASDLAAWRGGEHHNKWLDEQEAKETADKEGFEKRGHTKGSHFYEGIPLLPHREHVSKYPRVKTLAERQAEQKVNAPAKEVPEAKETAPAPAVAPKGVAVPPVKRTPTDKAAGMDKVYQTVLKSPEVKLKLMQASPEFAAYVKQKEGK